MLLYHLLIVEVPSELDARCSELTTFYDAEKHDNIGDFFTVDAMINVQGVPTVNGRQGECSSKYISRYALIISFCLLLVVKKADTNLISEGMN